MRDIVNQIESALSRPNCKVSLAQRGKAKELLVAEVIAMNLALPTSVVSNTREYFTAHHKIRTLEIASKINEHTVVNLDRLEDVTYRIWRIRYMLVHDYKNPFVGRILHHAVCCDTTTLPGDLADFVKENPKVCLYNDGEVKQEVSDDE